MAAKTIGTIGLLIDCDSIKSVECIQCDSLKKDFGVTVEILEGYMYTYTRTKKGEKENMNLRNCLWWEH